MHHLATATAAAAAAAAAGETKGATVSCEKAGTKTAEMSAVWQG